jgi:Holliday junction resolvase-like predicted endonuclease
MRVEELNAGTDSLSDIKQDTRQRGVRGETFAYWYLRRHGYVFVARNYVPPDVTGEIDLIGYDREALVFVEERMRARISRRHPT